MVAEQGQVVLCQAAAFFLWNMSHNLPKDSLPTNPRSSARTQQLASSNLGRQTDANSGFMLATISRIRESRDQTSCSTACAASSMTSEHEEQVSHSVAEKTFQTPTVTQL